MPHATARIDQTPEGLLVALAGTWRLNEMTPRFDAVLGAMQDTRPEAAPHAAPTADHPEAHTLGFDSSALLTWDSSLLIFLRQGQAFCDQHSCRFDATGLPAQVSALLALATVVPERAAEPVAPALSAVTRFGVAGIATWDSFRDGITFLGETADSLRRLLSGKVRFQWRAFWVVVQSNSSGALPIVTLIALLVGVIIAFLGVVVLEQFGAGYYVSYLVGYGMLREMGALMTGIIIAGRTGAGFAAEIGSMKITEELDAYATLGISAIDHLVLPRVLGLFVMLPLLAVYADVVGIVGGLGVSVALLDLSPTQFFGGMLTAVSLSDALLGVFKATIYGALIGFAGCMHGLRTGSDASAVGRSATSAVVLGITLIIIANAIVDWLAALWHV